MNEVKISSSRSGGWLSHYFHFLIDFVHPFHDWYTDSGLSLADQPLMLYLEVRDESDRLHEMTQRFSQLYPNVKLREVSSQEFAEVHCEAVTTLGWGTRGKNFDPESVANFGSYHGLRAEVGIATGQDVVLIDRGVEAKVTGRSNGAQRRNISNCNALARGLSAEFGDRFIRAVLEDLSMHEQIRLFHHARCVIGSHGAGFANISFCERQPASAIEIISPETAKRKHFLTLAAARGMDHAHVQIPSGDAPVDVESLVLLAKSQLT